MMLLERACYCCGRIMRFPPPGGTALVCADCWHRFGLSDERLLSNTWPVRPVVVRKSTPLTENWSLL